MATVNVVENILERENVNTYNDVKCKTVEEAVLQFTGNDAYAGQLVEVWNPETDETTYESAEETDGPLSVSVLVNGKTESLDYEIREDDVVFIIVLPSGGKSGASWLGAVIGLVVAVGLTVATYGVAGVIAGETAGIAANIGGIVIAGLAGAVAGYALGGSIYDMNHRDEMSSDAGEEGQSYPGVKGAKNQPLLGKPFPFVLGRHMITPPYIASPYTRSGGKYGEEQTMKILFAAGYAPLRLTNFKLGDLYLAYNKRTVNNPENHTVMHGRLKTANDDNLKTSYSWVSCSQSEIDGLVAKKYLAEHKGEYDTYEYVSSSERDNHGVYAVYSDGNWYYRRKVKRNYVWYESKNNNIRVLGASIYDKGDVQRYTASTTMSGDTGEILHRWINNDVKLEILQQNEESAVDYGTIYSDVIKQDSVNATPLYVVDDLINHVALDNMISYKGSVFANGFRNNTVRFTRSNPMRIEVELEASNGLYRTYTHSDNGRSETRYESIPVYYAIQWRPYNTGNSESFAENWKNNSYEFSPNDNPTGWRSFDFLNKYTDSNGAEHKIVPVKYTAERHSADIAAHTGNSGIGGASEGWIGCNVFDLGSLIDAYGGTDKDRVSMQRFTVEADLSALGAEWLSQNILGIGCTDAQKKHGINTNSMAEVRVIRVSPSYMNETGSSDEHNSAKQYSDVVKWNTISTFTFDRQILSRQGVVASEKVATESDMRKLCVIGLKVKADTGGNIQNQLSKFNCVAEAFAPTFDSDKNVWYPSDVHKITKYYEQPDFNIDGNTEPDIDTSKTLTKEQYEAQRQNGTPSLKRKCGNNYYSLLCRDIFKTENINTFAEKGITYTRYFLDNDTKDKYVSANAASSTILSAIGRQNGIDALGYSDLNLMHFAGMYEFCKQVSDGSTYPADEIVELDDLGTVEHRAGDTVMIPYNCNAYITAAVKVEVLMQKCIATARGMIVRDQDNKIKPVIDREAQYPVMLINQQNTISGTNMITYDNVPAGLQFNYEDEDDENSAASLYVMDDGENYKNPTKEIENYSVDFVTNRHQLYSLGRYILGTRKLQREVLTRKVGAEGFCAEIGDLVDVQDDTLLIGTDLGARVREIIEDDEYIYGIVTDETFRFTDESDRDEETGEERACQGVELIQPTKYKASRVVSYRCAHNGRSVTLSRVVIGGQIYNAAEAIDVNGTRYYLQDNREERILINGTYYDYYYDIDSELYPVKNMEYKMTVGDTNVIIFDRKISKSGAYTPGAGYYKEGVDSAPAQITYYKPEIDDIVAFGKVGKITSRYMITKIKPDKDFNFDLTLVQYNDQIYFAGDKLPVWTANITVPDRAKEEAFTLNDSLSLAELQQVVTDTVKNVVKVIGDGIASVDKPDTPSIMSAAAERDCIRLKCAPMSKGLKNSVIKANWQIHVWRTGDSTDQSGWTWQDFDRVDGKYTSTSDTNADYNFNRSKTVDGYPERTDLVRDSKYYFRVQVVNSYNRSSEWSEGALVSADSYGTWIPKKPYIVSERVSGRIVTLVLGQPERSDGKELYGTPMYLLGVKRTENNTFYNPAQSENPYDSEFNYRQGGADGGTAMAVTPLADGAVTTQHAYTQTMPLSGQNDVIRKFQIWYADGTLDQYNEEVKYTPHTVYENIEETGSSIATVSFMVGTKIAVIDGIKYGFKGVGGEQEYILFNGYNVKPIDDALYIIEVDGAKYGILKRADGSYYYINRVNTDCTLEDDGVTKVEILCAVFGYGSNFEEAETYNAESTYFYKSDGYYIQKDITEEQFVPGKYYTIKTGVAFGQLASSGYETERFVALKYSGQVYEPVTGYTAATEYAGPHSYFTFDGLKHVFTENPDWTSGETYYYVGIRAGSSTELDRRVIFKGAAVYASADNLDGTFSYVMDGVEVTEKELDRHITYTTEEGAYPTDTSYTFRVIAYTVDNETGGMLVCYDGTQFIDRNVMALATGVADIVNSAITENKIADGAVTVDKLAAGSITAEKIAVKDLFAITGVFGKIQNNKIESSSSNRWNLETGHFLLSNGVTPQENDSESEYFEYVPAGETSWSGVQVSAGTFFFKIANFIITSISSIIAGIFRVKSRGSSESQSFISVNPNNSADTVTDSEGTLVTPAKTMAVNGDVKASGKFIGALNKTLTIKQTMSETTTDTFDGSENETITITGYDQSLNKADTPEFKGVILKKPENTDIDGLIWYE